MRKIHPLTNNSQNGAVLVEFSLTFFIWLLILGFTIDGALVLKCYATLNHTTDSLTRYLADELGKAWSTESISQSPFGGSCNAFIRERGNAFLAGKPGNSMDNLAGTYYFGTTIEDSTALFSDPNSPYAILRIVGTARPVSLLGMFFRSSLLTTQSSALVEFHTSMCTEAGY